MTSANSAPAVKLGDELTVSAIGFGAMALTPVYGEVDDVESLATLNRTLDLGVTFIDTANIYGNGNNEKLIAKLLADRRDEVTLATKFCIEGNPADRAAGQIGVRGDAAYVRQSIDESLQRLQTDVVDLNDMHRRDVNIPIEETVGVVGRVGGRRQGAPPRALRGDSRRVAGRSRGASDRRGAERVVDLEPRRRTQRRTRGGRTRRRLCAVFASWARVLDGTISSVADLSPTHFRRKMPRYAESALDANLAVVELVKSVAAEQGATPAQVALAWLRYRAEALGVASVPIPGTGAPNGSRRISAR